MNEHFDIDIINGVLEYTPDVNICIEEISACQSGNENSTFDVYLRYKQVDTKLCTFISGRKMCFDTFIYMCKGQTYIFNTACIRVRLRCCKYEVDDDVDRFFKLELSDEPVPMLFEGDIVIRSASISNYLSKNSLVICLDGEMYTVCTLGFGGMQTISLNVIIPKNSKNIELISSMGDSKITLYGLKFLAPHIQAADTTNDPRILNNPKIPSEDICQKDLDKPCKVARCEPKVSIETVRFGHGDGAVVGDTINVAFIGKLESGLIFDRTRSAPFTFALGQGDVIAGWDQGLVGIKIGETRVLKIPSSLGYGKRKVGKIPKNSNLVFRITRVRFKGKR